MPRAKDADREPADPAKPIRFPVVITVAQRARLRVVAAMLTRPMEDVAGDWVAERLAEEEKRLRVPKPH